MKTLIGHIVSTKMDKTVVVEVIRQVKHPLYQKVLKRSKKLKAHNDKLTLKVGDRVKIINTRPISKEKHFKVVEKI